VETVYGMVSNSEKAKGRNIQANAEPSFSMKVLLKV